MSPKERIQSIAKEYIPVLARLLLLSSFLDDCWRIIFTYRERFAHVSGVYQMAPFAAHTFLVTMFALESVACVLVVARKRIGVACIFFATVLTIHFVMMVTRFFFYKTLFR